MDNAPQSSSQIAPQLSSSTATVSTPISPVEVTIATDTSPPQSNFATVTTNATVTTTRGSSPSITSHPVLSSVLFGESIPLQKQIPLLQDVSRTPLQHSSPTAISTTPSALLPILPNAMLMATKLTTTVPSSSSSASQTTSISSHKTPRHISRIGSSSKQLQQMTTPLPAGPTKPLPTIQKCDNSNSSSLNNTAETHNPPKRPRKKQTHKPVADKDLSCIKPGMVSSFSMLDPSLPKTKTPVLAVAIPVIPKPQVKPVKPRPPLTPARSPVKPRVSPSGRIYPPCPNRTPTPPPLEPPPISRLGNMKFQEWLRTTAAEVPADPLTLASWSKVPVTASILMQRGLTSFTSPFLSSVTDDSEESTLTPVEVMPGMSPGFRALDSGHCHIPYVFPAALPDRLVFFGSQYSYFFRLPAGISWKVLVDHYVCLHHSPFTLGVICDEMPAPTSGPNLQYKPILLNNVPCKALLLSTDMLQLSLFVLSIANVISDD